VKTLDVSNLKVGFYNWIVVGIMALLFIVFLKMIVGKWPIPGVTEVANAA